MTDRDIDVLFEEALQVVNRAMEENRDHPVFGRILGLMDTHLEGHRSNILVYEDDPAARRAFFTVEYGGGGFRLLTRGKGPHETQWKVSVDYLTSLVEDPDRYVEDPTRLDLDWLATRIPDGARQLFRWGTRAPE